MNLKRALIAPAILAAATLAGCASSGASPASEVSSAQALVSNADSAAAAAGVTPSAPASSAPCTTNACIISDAKSTLIGSTAKDESVMTKLSCRSSTVKKVTASVWTVHCTADYSDGSIAEGIASVNLGTSYVSWEPTSIISDGSGG